MVCINPFQRKGKRGPRWVVLCRVEGDFWRKKNFFSIFSWTPAADAAQRSRDGDGNKLAAVRRPAIGRKAIAAAEGLAEDPASLAPNAVTSTLPKAVASSFYHVVFFKPCFGHLLRRYDRFFSLHSLVTGSYFRTEEVWITFLKNVSSIIYKKNDSQLRWFSPASTKKFFLRFGEFRFRSLNMNF